MNGYSEGQHCSNCKYHIHEDVDDGYVCVNDESEYCTDWTEYDFCCDEFEAKC
ncbi:MAG: hypothetical protein LUH55_00745 [Bacteroides thetaiotaomicron]|nr:hypothetical protein [Bacteroides thetaiotaomicron]